MPSSIDPMGILDDENIEDFDKFLSVTLINPKSKTKTKAYLQDESGTNIPLKDIIGQLSQYTLDSLESKVPTDTTTKIFPLMAGSIGFSLLKFLGPQMSILYLSNPTLRFALIHTMTIGLLLLKFAQKNNLKIMTEEEEVTEEEIKRLQRMDKVTNIVTLAAAAGVHPKDAIKELYKSGQITKDDLNDLLSSEEQSDTGNGSKSEESDKKLS